MQDALLSDVQVISNRGFSFNAEIEDMAKYRSLIVRLYVPSIDSMVLSTCRIPISQIVFMGANLTPFSYHSSGLHGG